LGHLSPGRARVTASIPSATAQPAAIASSGQSRAAARTIVSPRRTIVRCRTETAAGGNGRRTDPSGQTISTGRSIPSLAGIVRSVTARVRYAAQAQVLAQPGRARGVGGGDAAVLV